MHELGINTDQPTGHPLQTLFQLFYTKIGESGRTAESEHGLPCSGCRELTVNDTASHDIFLITVNVNRLE